MATSAPAVSGPPPGEEGGPPLPRMEGGPPLPGLEGEEAPQKRKATSFKITNVFLSRPPSNDGDDSCEDGEELEDSRTEDLSDITDANSLNSLSSKLESLDFVNNPVIVNGGILQSSSSQSNGPTAASTKPPAAPAKTKTSPGQQPKEAAGGSRKPHVTEGRDRRPSWDKAWEPQSFLPYAHPGFGFVTYEQTTGGVTYPVSYVDNATGFIPVAGTMAVINNVVSGGVSEVPVSSQAVVGPQDFKLRFKIVKVETTEPLKRGRWTCLDFNDKPAVKEGVVKEGEGKVRDTSGGKSVTTTSTGVVNPERGQSRAEGSRVPGQTEPLPRSGELEKVGEDWQGQSGRLEGQAMGQSVRMEGQSVRLASVPPEERRGQQQASQQPPQFPATYNGGGPSPAPQQGPPSSGPPLSIALPPQSSGGALSTSVQSPGAQLNNNNRPPVPVADFSTATLGQVVQLPNGQLAQVSLTPMEAGAVAAMGGAPPIQGVAPPAGQPAVVPRGGVAPPAGQQQGQFPATPQPSVVLKQPPLKQVQPQQQPPQQQQQPAPALQPQQQQQTSAPQQQAGGQTVVLNSAGQQYLAPQGGAVTVATGQPGAPGRGQAAPRPQGPQGGGKAPQSLGGPASSSTPQPMTSPAPPGHAQFSPQPGAQQAASGAGPPPMQQSVPPSTVSSAAPAPRTGGTGAGVRTPGAPAVIASTAQVSSGAQYSGPPAYPLYQQYSEGGGAEGLYRGGEGVLVSEGVAAEGLYERLEDLVAREEGEVKESQWVGELAEHESASGAGQGSIDNRIEQAMDLVKSHLMSAVRSEVEELRDKISKLEDTVGHLSRENEVLRSHVPPEVLSQLTAGRTLMGPPILNSLPPPEPSHPALQPPQH